MIAVADECSGTRNHRLALGEATLNFDIASLDAADAYPSRLDSIITDDLNDRAPPGIQNSRQRDSRSAALLNFNFTAAKGSDTQRPISVKKETDFTKLRGSIDSCRNKSHLA